MKIRINKDLIKNSKHQRHLLGGVIMVVVLLSILLIPLLYSAGFAQAQVENSLNERTQVVLLNPLAPEFIIYSVSDEYEARANAVRLTRQYLLGWQVQEISFESIQTDNPDSARAAVNDLEQAISAENIGIEGYQNNPANYTNTNQFAQENTQALTSAETIITSIREPQGRYDVQVIAGGDKLTNYVEINGEQMPALINVSSLHFNTDFNYLYYSTYVPAEQQENPAHTEIEPSGQIYRYDLDTNAVESVYTFDNSYSLSFRTNTQHIAYATNTGEVGVINLSDKNKQLISTPVFANEIHSEIAGDVEISPIQVISIGQNNASYSVTTNTSEDGWVENFYLLDLETLEFSQAG